MIIHRLSAKTVKIENGFSFLHYEDENNSNTYLRILNMLQMNKQLYADTARQILGGDIQEEVPLDIICKVNFAKAHLTEEELIREYDKIDKNDFGISDVGMTVTYSLKS